MTDNKWNSATLRISSNTISAAEITVTLGIKPTKSYEKGTLVSSRNPKSLLRQDSVWFLESGLDTSEPLDTHIAKLISLVEENLDLFKELILVCHVDIFCGFSSENGQGGFVLDAGLLKRLAVIPVDIVLDLYPPAK